MLPAPGFNPLALSKDDVTVVIPVLNEERGVAAVIDEVKGNGYQNILVVDGYSTDSSAEVARLKGANVIFQQGRGKTGAIKTAIDNVATSYLLVMDGDHTYDAADIQRFLDHARLYDEIVGARNRDQISRLHRFGNRVISYFFNALMGTTISDVCSGMYLLDSRFAKDVYLQSTGFSVEVEVLAQTALHGRATEVPINYRRRIGKPKLTTWGAGFDILKSIFNLARRYNPVFLFSIIAGLAALPGIALLFWVFFLWGMEKIFHSGWAIAGTMLLLLSTQAFMVGTLAVLIKRSEFRVEALVRRELESRTRTHT